MESWTRVDSFMLVDKDQKKDTAIETILENLLCKNYSHTQHTVKIAMSFELRAERYFCSRLGAQNSQLFSRLSGDEILGEGF
jgi:hypothetical protein